MRTFDTSPAPHLPPRRSVAQVMGLVLLALLPGIAAHAWFFGPGIGLVRDDGNRRQRAARISGGQLRFGCDHAGFCLQTDSAQCADDVIKMVGGHFRPIRCLQPSRSQKRNRSAFAPVSSGTNGPAPFGLSDDVYFKVAGNVGQSFRRHTA